MGIVLGVVVLLGGAGAAVYLLLPRTVSQAELERAIVETTRGGLGQAPQSASCPGSLRYEVDMRVDCTLRLADATDVPARVTVKGTDGGSDDFFVKAAVVPKEQLEENLSADIAQKYKRIAMTCAGDLAGVPGASTDCDGIDNSGVSVHVKATLDRLDPDLGVVPKYTPYDTAEEVAQVVSTTATTNIGVQLSARCDDDLQGVIGTTTNCTLTAADGSTLTVVVTVANVSRSYYLEYQVAPVS